MLDTLRPAMTRLFTPVGKVLARTPITPNVITVVGTVGVLGGGLGLLPIGELFPGAFTCTIFVLLDMLKFVTSVFTLAFALELWSSRAKWAEEVYQIVDDSCEEFYSLFCR